MKEQDQGDEGSLGMIRGCSTIKYLAERTLENITAPVSRTPVCLPDESPSVSV